jgi:signal transduction histidine kinase
VTEPVSPSANEPGEPAGEAAAEVEPAAPRVARESSPVPVLTVDAPTAVHEQVADEVIELVPAPDPIRGLAGEIAVDIAHQLAEPVRGLRDRLGLVVDHIERHVATATGPTPYPWRALQTLRQDLAAAYLDATTLARRLDELDRALRETHASWFDVAAAVELGVHLAGHHLGPGIEVLIDLGNPPLARGVAGPIALVVAQIVAVSARSARDLPGSTVSVRVASEPACALVAIADNGAGSARAAGLGELARGIVAAWGGTVDAASLPGAGCTFELRLSTVRDEPG